MLEVIVKTNARRYKQHGSRNVERLGFSIGTAYVHLSSGASSCGSAPASGGVHYDEARSYSLYAQAAPCAARGTWRHHAPPQAETLASWFVRGRRPKWIRPSGPSCTMSRRLSKREQRQQEELEQLQALSAVDEREEPPTEAPPPTAGFAAVRVQHTMAHAAPSG